MKVEKISVKEIRPYEDNPRYNDEAVQYVKESIKQFGFKVPMVITSDGVIVTGHTRFKASLELGYTEVPCVIADDLSEEQVQAFRLADNRVSEIAEWDEGLLFQELQEMEKAFDLGAFGFSLDDFEIKLADDEEEKEEEPEVKFTEELLEENNYVVLFFDNSVDWLQALSLFELEPVKALDSKEGYKKVGTGRVINGAKALQKIMGVE